MQLYYLGELYFVLSFNPLDPSLLGIAASPPEPSEAVGPIGDIIIGHIKILLLAIIKW